MKTGRRSRSHPKRSAVVETTAAEAEAEVLKLQKPLLSRLPRKSNGKVASAEVVATEAVPPWDMKVPTIQTVTTGPT